MNFFFTLISQRKAVARASIVYLASFILLGAAALQPFVEVSDLTRDTIAIFKGRFYHGLFSNIGVLVWCSAAAVCFLTAWLLRSLKTKSSFAFFAGLITAALLLDDFFLLHEQVAPQYLNINEKYVMLLYPVSIAAFIIFFRQSIFASSYIVLLSSLGFLGLSMSIDIFIPGNQEIQHLFEEGAKLLGIVGWAFYFISTCVKLIEISLWKDRFIVSELDSTLSTLGSPRTVPNAGKVKVIETEVEVNK